MMKERVARVKYERTMTMKEKGAQSAKTFEDLLGDREAAGMTEDEKMSLAAKRMQEKFNQEETDVKQGRKSVSIHELVIAWLL